MKRPDWINTTSSASIFLIAGFFVHSVYLIMSGAASLVYIANVLLHVPLGLIVLYLLVRLIRSFRLGGGSVTAAILLIVFSTVVGAVLLWKGNTMQTSILLHLHSVTILPVAFMALIGCAIQHKRKTFQRASLFGLAAAVLVVLAFSLLPSNPDDTISNEILPALTMAEASMGGEEGLFFPSPSETSNGGLIPSTYFEESQTCGTSGCHVDAYEQWNRSAHHFSSFNNQWYRKSIEYMQEVVGTEPAKWCAGCHDHAVLFSGQMDQPVSEFVNTEAAQAGLGCISCHAIKKVKNTGGNGAFVMGYPRLHGMASSDNRVLKTLHDLTLRLDPEPHRRAFMKPFLLKQPSEFCSSCHKVHLDQPVNDYRWVRGFNTYDNWQASGISHQGARSFYQPFEAQTCVSCHMPRTVSADPGADHGTIKAHDFIAANTALPTANQDQQQLDRTTTFLSSNQLSVDIFAVSKPNQQDIWDSTSEQERSVSDRIQTTFAVGEEQGSEIGVGGSMNQEIDVYAPLEDNAAVLVRGTIVRLDVVVRTLGVGHFFPSGTVDAQEAWLEVKVVDNKGRVVLWSGYRDQDGNVDPSAHFYKSLMIDEMGNPIDKRNSFASRSVVYVNLIPPGAADVGHFEIEVPGDATSLSVSAKLNYRKFIRSHTRFAYAGRMDSTSGTYSTSFDNRSWTEGEIGGEFGSVSGKLQTIPTVPVVVMASDSATLALGDAYDLQVSALDYSRWTDYGIGLLRQRDLTNASMAFGHAQSIDPQNVESLINLARVFLDEGDMQKAGEALAEASAIDSLNHKVNFFGGLLSKSLGDYNRALDQLLAVNGRYPEDRVVLNQIGRVLFLSERYEEAVDYFEAVLSIDAEDLMAHYNLMILQRALGNETAALAHEKRYERYKADEKSQAIARSYRQEHPHDNNEAQQIHVHRNYYPN